MSDDFDIDPREASVGDDRINFYVDGTVTYRFRVLVAAKNHDDARAIVEGQETYSARDLADDFSNDEVEVSAEVVTPFDDQPADDRGEG